MAAISVVCPHCRTQQAFEAGEGFSDTHCPKCRSKVRLLCARVKSGRSRADKKTQTRQYAVRLVYAGTEDLVEFKGPYDEFNMRAGDWMTFGYDAGKWLAVVQNVTLARVLEFPRPRNGWIFATLALLGVVVVALVAGLMLRH